MWYNYVILLLALLSAFIQLWGAKLETRICGRIKIAYAISLFLASFFIILMEIVEETEFGYAMALVVVLFTILLGSINRLIYLRRNERECPYL